VRPGLRQGQVEVAVAIDVGRRQAAPNDRTRKIADHPGGQLSQERAWGCRSGVEEELPTLAP
jgi:hypothetical protein